MQYRNLRIFYKILLLNLALILLFTGFTWLGVGHFLRLYDQQLYQKTMQVIAQFSSGVETDLKQVESFSLSIMLDPDIQEELGEMQKGTGAYEQLVQAGKLQAKLSIQSMTQKNLSAINYIDNAGKVIAQGDNLLESDSAEQVRALLKRAKAAQGGYVFSEPNIQNEQFFSAREIIQYQNLSLKSMGTLLLSYDLKGIVESNEKKIQDTDTQLLLYADNRMIFRSQNGKSVAKPAAQNGYRIQTINGEKYFVVTVKSDYLGWVYVSVLPYDTTFQQNILIRDFLIAAALLLLAVSCFFSFRIARNITKPLEDLTNSMKQVETGCFDKVKADLYDYRRGDEVGILQKDFLLMVERINQLIKQNYEKQLAIQETKYKALQSQINPHFLYNTLSSISWLAKVGRGDEVSNMVLSLSNLLRASVNEQTVIFLEEEVDLLKNYLHIQKMRYTDRICFSVHIAPQYLDLVVPKMILQPVVENAILYGAENMLGVCKISVWVQDAGENCQLCVRDNGPDIPQQQLKALNAFQYVPHGTGIGLKNIQERLQLLFGAAYGLHVQSGNGQTTVCMTLPKKGA
ncbi:MULTISPECIES: cache domain-containing sensor histidine kinase [Caproicibacterium]|uniref:Sensor histidine kinase n=1 Tax=Caproicibacterium argilliputei TaxID=3030016 RepID=A0AA97H1T6_9FIRM|nr:sensor histidine kinase [Caproicibacterium argilliputei]WOC32836.1 sensor histidine kinase [Caproicibacterium argilliputei]